MIITTSNKASDGSSKKALASVKTVAKCLLQRLGKRRKWRRR
jgi:hypothetical protein